MHYRISALIAIPCLLTLVACGPSSKGLGNYDVRSNLHGLELDESAKPTLVYKKPGAAPLGDYSRFIVDPVEVSYDDPKMKELKPEDVGRMQQSFRDAMIKELRDGGYVVGTRSEANTLRIGLTLTGLSAPSAAANVSQLAAPLALSVGQSTVEAEFRDAVTGEVQAVVVTRMEGSRVFNPTPWSSWADVESGFGKWASGFRKAVDDAQKK